jgi:hypothetical protein
MYRTVTTQCEANTIIFITCVDFFLLNATPRHTPYRPHCRHSVQTALAGVSLCECLRAFDENTRNVSICLLDT